MKTKLALLPCNGIGQAISTLVRQACYRAQKEASAEIEIINNSALAGGVEEEFNKLNKYQVLLIDGCIDHCGRYTLEEYGLEDFKEIFAPVIIGKNKLSMKNVSRSNPGQVGEKIIIALKDEIIEHLKALKEGDL